MIHLTPTDAGGIDLCGDDAGHTRLSVEDNYRPEHLRGQSLCISIAENVVGERAEELAVMSIDRADVERLRDWLNSWLVRYYGAAD